MKTKRFDFNWRPLQLQVAIAADGSVPGSQNYNADAQEYTPDYTLTPFILQPSVSVLDKDGVLTSGSVNHKLANVRWYEIYDGKRVLINTDNKNYEVETSGGNAGRIKVKRNAEPKNPLTLEFYAEYADDRNGQLLVIRGSYMVSCDSSSDVVRVELDAAGQTVYNPLSDKDEQTLTATVWVGDRICGADKYALTWEVQGEDNAWRAAGADSVTDYDVSVLADGRMTVNRRLMGDSINIRCRVRYSPDGTTGSVALTDASPQTEVAIVRRIPKFEYDISGVPYNIPAGILSIAPSAIIRTTNGDIAAAERELLPLWYIATNKASGSLNYQPVGHGLNPVIPTRALSEAYGAVLGLDVKDRGYYGAFEDAADNAILCDSDGSILIIH